MCNVQCATDNVQCAVLGGRSVRTTLPLLPACLTAQCTLKLRLTQLWANLMSHVPVMCLMYMQRKVPSYPPAPFFVLMQIIFMQVYGFANSSTFLDVSVTGHSLEGTTVILQSPPSHITCDCALLICKFWAPSAWAPLDRASVLMRTSSCKTLVCKLRSWL